jgi:hypothetical protein
MTLTLFEPSLPIALSHTLTPVSLQLPTDLTAQQWQHVGAALQRLDEARQWWLGDWWIAGHKYGERSQLCEEIGIVFGTAANAGTVSRAIETSRRREVLSFKHHTEVCAIDDPDVQDRFLLWCEETIEATGKPRPTRELNAAIRSYLDSQGWTDFERERRRWVEDLGYPTLANHTLDTHLLQWAKMTGKHVYIGRGSKWGNPFEIGKDGDRKYVIDSYCFHYLPRKQSLIDALPELDGKVLECYCVPEHCHGEVLIETLRREAWELLDEWSQKGYRHAS